MSEALVVFCTVDGLETAERLARDLVEKRLCACVNVLPPLVSIYRWQGAIERSEERLLVIKTTRARFEQLRQAIVAQHPYDVPEVIALPVVAGHPPYLAWLEDGTRPEP